MCDKCNNGLIPFVKNGRLIPHAYLYCDCHPIYGVNPGPEHYQPISPEDYDFPMSETFRAWTFQHCGVPDPGYVPPQADIADMEDRIGNLEAISAEPGRMPRRFHDDLKQIKSELRDLQSKVMQRRVEATQKEVTVGHNREDITNRLYR